MMSDEGVAVLERYIDNAVMAKLEKVTVIHGKGTGALREGVHRLLETMPGVASWTWPAGAQSGGWGATWVFLESRL